MEVGQDLLAFTLLTLPGHDLASARAARHHVRDMARSWSLPTGAADDLESITAELVANALEHSDSRTLTVTCALTVGRVAVSVTDEGEARDGRTPIAPGAPRTPPPEHEHGRGLLITDSLAARWGSRQSGEGLTVWAEVLAGASKDAAR
ncbi:ATP-binding protein [Streptomyces sp. NPDC050619]|uniref:ATP-binding protein n=1 Tax=Streptomyces sp. NPDC050619 TaxID=3157214 RepID=UPI003427217C